MEKYFVKKATALKYETDENAPKVTAQGINHNANTIIKIAQENNVPIKKDEDLVNMLSEIELNQEIPVELYRSVAEIFSFVYGITNEKKDQ